MLKKSVPEIHAKMNESQSMCIFIMLLGCFACIHYGFWWLRKIGVGRSNWQMFHHISFVAEMGQVFNNIFSNELCRESCLKLNLLLA